MKPNIPIALGAGAITAVVFASATTGPTVARMLLLAIVTLPVALAGLSYNAATALLAAVVATVIVALIVSPMFGVVFALTTVLPTAGLIYLALLHRAAAAPAGADGAPSQTQWYPIGTAVVASALMSGCIVGASLHLVAGQGSGLAKLRQAVTEAVKQALKGGFAGLPGQTLPDADIAALSDRMLNLMPGLSAATWMGSILLCLWLAGHVALASGQLARPWPHFGTMAYPAGTSLLLAAALAAGMMLDGLPRLIALGFAGALYVAYVLLGLAIIHQLTRRYQWRSPMLSTVYLLLLVLTVPVSFMIALVALVDSIRPLRSLSSAVPP